MGSNKPDRMRQSRRGYGRAEFERQKKILINEKREATLNNISLGGVCFQSQEPYDVGSEIIVGNHLMSLCATVLDCSPQAREQAGQTVPGHDVRCKYIATDRLLQEELLMNLVMADAPGALAI